MGSGENKLLPTIEDGKVSKITLTAESPDARKSLIEGSTAIHLRRTVTGIYKIRNQSIFTLVLHYTDDKPKPRVKKQKRATLRYKNRTTRRRARKQARRNKSA